MRLRATPVQKGGLGRLFAFWMAFACVATLAACAGVPTHSALTGTVVLQVSPAGPVVVWVDDQRVAVRSAGDAWIVASVLPGRRRVAISRDGHLVERRDVVVEASAATEVLIELWPVVPELDGAVGR